MVSSYNCRIRMTVMLSVCDKLNWQFPAKQSQIYQWLLLAVCRNSVWLYPMVPPVDSIDWKSFKSPTRFVSIVPGIIPVFRCLTSNCSITCMIWTNRLLFICWCQKCTGGSCLSWRDCDQMSSSLDSWSRGRAVCLTSHIRRTSFPNLPGDQWTLRSSTTLCLSAALVRSHRVHWYAADGHELASCTVCDALYDNAVHEWMSYIIMCY